MAAIHRYACRPMEDEEIRFGLPPDRHCDDIKAEVVKLNAAIEAFNSQATSPRPRDTSDEPRDTNEGVILKLPSDSLLRIYSNLTGRMHELGYERLDWDVLDLGFVLRPDWPLFGPGPTLAQMVVVAHKLRLRIVIDELHVESFSVNRPPPRRVNPAPEAGKPAVGGKESAVAGGDCECG